MKKNIFKISSALLLSVFALTSCHKTVTPRKLDGEWTVTAGSETYTETNSSINTSKDSYTKIFNGTTETKTSTWISSLGIVSTQTISKPMTISYTFDKKKGTYKKTTIETSTNTNLNIAYYSKNLTNLYNFDMYDEIGKIDQKDVEVSTITEEGTFTITGGTGDIEKNTQIVLLRTSYIDNSSNTYTYFKGVNSFNDITNYYIKDYNSGFSYISIPTTKQSKNISTVLSTDAKVLTVVSLKKGVMEITESESYTKNSGASTYSDKTDIKWTLTAK
jgi:hypothetical protein